MTDSATYTTPEASEEDLGDLLLAVLPPDGKATRSYDRFNSPKLNRASMNQYVRRRKAFRLSSLFGTLCLICTQTPIALAGSKVPDFCGTSGLTEAQETECLKAKSEKKNDQVGNIELIPPKYPVRIDLLGLNDEYNLSKAVEVNLLAASDKEIKIKYRNSDLYILIPSERIVRWGIGEGNKVDASGAIGMAAGAIFFPPMLLAAPFGIRNVKTNQYQVQYIDPYGEIKSLSLNATMYHKETLSLLRYASGLKPGIPRDETSIRSLEEKTLLDLADQRNKKAMEIIVSNPKKPWCEYIDTTKNEAAYTRYKLLTDYIQKLSVRLRVSAPVVQVESSQESKWENYLQENPGLKQWVKTYPTQASKLRECPAITK
jgi:hypothetical protein